MKKVKRNMALRVMRSILIGLLMLALMLLTLDTAFGRGPYWAAPVVLYIYMILGISFDINRMEGEEL